MKRKSVEQLAGFLEEYYIDNPQMDSSDMSTAIRDALTDLLHLGDEFGVNIQSRLLDAEEVYSIEIEE